MCSVRNDTPGAGSQPHATSEGTIDTSSQLPSQSATWAPSVRALISELTFGIPAVLGDGLVGLYLYGSMVTGDFDERISDIDLLAVTRVDLDADQLDRLDAAHGRIEQRYPAWVDRIEIAYLSTTALATFRQIRSPIAVISPGEPLHIKDAGGDWLINWYIVRTQALTLLGPPAHDVIEEITTDELRQAVRAQTQQWRQYVHSASHPGFQAYAILTACRGLYTYEHAVIVSKQRSAQWAKQRLPQWGQLIDQALRLRALGGRVGEADHAETVRFVNAIADQINPATAP